jgi:tRNA modification GTPase
VNGLDSVDKWATYLLVNFAIVQKIWDDTIVAVATPPGVGAIGMIRLSGKEAVNIANELFPSKDLDVQRSHTLHVGSFSKNGTVIDEVVMGLYRAPRSFTGEDVVEISFHGSPYIAEKIMSTLIDGGARPARPGEFTQRAFINGKMDLAQAEAVADLIASNTEASRRTALHAMRGGFSEVLSKLREELLKFSALIELELDFSQEDVEFADRSEFYVLLNQALTITNDLLRSFQLGNVIRNGVQVAIVGKPNAGKSTLLNALLNEERAIVSEIAGTTRDTIEEVLNIDGILFRLVDTAGIREHTTDAIERIGVERSLEKIQQSSLVVYLFDLMEMDPRELKKIKAQFDIDGIRYILAANKIDHADAPEVMKEFSDFNDIISISAQSKENVEKLKKMFVDKVAKGKIDSEETIITNARHYDALKQVDKSLHDILSGLDTKLPLDLVALDIRRCLHYLGEITGEITNEEQLGWIFGKFCIGK